MKVEIIDLGNKNDPIAVAATHDDVWHIKITLENGQVFQVYEEPEGLEVASDRKVYLHQPGQNVVLVIADKKSES